jgi:hypothetical protein
MTNTPTYRLTLRAKPRALAPEKRLRALLKVAGRACALQCVRIEELINHEEYEAVNILEEACKPRFFSVDYLEGLGGERTYTIETVRHEDVEWQGKSDRKPCLVFEETTTMQVVNPTNARTLAARLGADTATWGGKVVTLRVSDMYVGGRSRKWVEIVVKGQTADSLAPPSVWKQPAKAVATRPPVRGKATAEAAKEKFDDLDHLLNVDKAPL